ncbi:porin family protein [Ferrimonas sp. SCSIO 43195]|uniref:porin family protein n=1 Tax=Ferrimonas sp. SCSIO 43195 TaxID=2822844 RepID=UPI002075E701|nr:porin family protein [Ferrimonas sp. SCSIO 43195]USD38951.1 porin family protein [Ferrimonas sp. SCSIO 43195]
MKPALLLCVALLPLHAVANTSSHSVEYQMDFSVMDSDRSDITHELNDVGSAHNTLSYRYAVTDWMSVGVGYLWGDSDDFALFPVDAFTDSKLEYQGIQYSVRLQLPLSQRNRLYLQANGLDFDYDVFDDGEVVGSDDGFDFGLSAGWRYEWDIGLGMKVGYDYQKLGDHIDIKGISVALSYRF